MKRLQKIVITGAPSSGKSSTLAALEKLKLAQVALVPESALVLLAGGYPAPDHGDLEQIRAFQSIILTLQDSLESILSLKNPHATHMVLDRAKLDGTAFWPPGPEDYFKNFPVDWKKELHRYDAVVFFELPEERHFGGIHQSRFHNYAQSVESGKLLQMIWSQHPKFYRVPACETLEKKVQSALFTLESLLRPT